MAADIEWYDDADALLTELPDLVVVRGDAGEPVTLRVYNDRDGTAAASTLYNLRLGSLARASETGAGVSEGLPPVDLGYVEARVVVALDGADAEPADWIPLEHGQLLPLADSLASTQGIEIEVRSQVPADSQGGDWTIELGLAWQTWAGKSTGLGSGDGVLAGVGDFAASWLLLGEDVAENPAGADDEIQVGDFRGLGLGIPWAYPSQLVAIAAAAAGLQRYDLLSFDADGALTMTAGDETASALTDDDEPAAPLGEQVVARIEVDDSGIIPDANIVNRWRLGGYHLTGSGSTVSVAPGSGVVGDRHTLEGIGQLAPVTLSATNRVWITRQGLLEVTITPRPGTFRGVLLGEAVADGSAITSVTDRRRWVGGRRTTLRLEIPGVLAVNDERLFIPPQPGGWLWLPESVVVLVGDGGVTGQTVVEVETDTGAGWVTIYSDATRRPTLPAAAGLVEDRASFPDTLFLGADPCRVRVVEVPSGTASTDLVVLLHLWEA
jgi:hypothetical protein